MRGRSGAVIADFQHAATPERIAANAAKLEEALRQLALEHRAQGGTEQTFINAAKTQAERIFAEQSTSETRGA